MKLNLGCGTLKFNDFVNIDHRKEVNPDKVEDVFTLPSFQSNSVDEIVASHVLEHACFDRTLEILERWKSLLIFRGILWIAVPNFELVYKDHLSAWKDKRISWEYFNSRIFGNSLVAKKMYGSDDLENYVGVKKYEIAFHRSVFTKEMLKQCIEECRFRTVEIVDSVPYKSKHEHEICCKAIK